MGARWKVLVTVAVVACVVALAGCASQGAPSSTSSSTGASSSSSSAASSSSAVAPQTGSTAEITLDYNAGTGYEWAYSADPEGVVELAGQNTESLSQDKTVSGGSLQEHFTFRAVKPGEVVLTFNLARSWESGAKPAETQIYAFTVTDNLQMILNPYKSDFANEPVIG
ncbi:MAG: protease inhibitor I42 family protein [Eggerthellaceae bacterium]|nr:protease inhibitor I42 family protein [Eggerthellaceae bacterium]